MNDWAQPIRPMRIHVRVSDYFVVHHVFAVGILDQVTFLTIDGQYIQQTKVAYSDTYIDHQWECVTRIP